MSRIFSRPNLATTLVVQIELSLRRVCLCVWEITFQGNNLRSRYYAGSSWCYPGHVGR